MLKQKIKASHSAIVTQKTDSFSVLDYKPGSQ